MASQSSATVRPRSSRARAYARIAALILLFLACLPPHLIAKAVSRSSPWPQRFLAGSARIAGTRVRVEGSPLGAHSLVLANHSSWLDILVLAGATGTRFVSKAEIAKAPLIGWLAEQHHTLYIDRAERGDAHGQVRRISDALADPRPLAIFPEGTTSDGRTLLPFRSTLLKAVAPPPPGTEVRPVAIDYHDAIDAIAWTGGEPGLVNSLRVLGMPGTRKVTIRLLDPLAPTADRKALARHAAQAIATALSSVVPRDALDAPAT
jgi:1-acyl-sn-glycerol-3-phosphate acyltransferase